MSANDLISAKAHLRKTIYERHMSASPELREKLSGQLSALLRAREDFQRSRILMFFSPLPDEPNLLPLLHQMLSEQRSVALPRFVPQTKSYEPALIKNWKTDLTEGKYGIWEPSAHCTATPLMQLDFVLVPGVAFDLTGYRLGRGKGYYDRLLLAVGAKKCGVAFDWQVEPTIPCESHDVRLDCLVTPTRCLDF